MGKYDHLVISYKKRKRRPRHISPKQHWRSPPHIKDLELMSDLEDQSNGDLIEYTSNAEELPPLCEPELIVQSDLEESQLDNERLNQVQDSDGSENQNNDSVIDSSGPDEQNEGLQDPGDLENESDDIVVSTSGLNSQNDDLVEGIDLQDPGDLENESDDITESTSGLNSQNDDLVEGIGGLNCESDDIVEGPSDLKNEDYDIIEKPDKLGCQSENNTEGSSGLSYQNVHSPQDPNSLDSPNNDSLQNSNDLSSPVDCVSQDSNLLNNQNSDVSQISISLGGQINDEGVQNANSGSEDIVGLDTESGSDVTHVKLNSLNDECEQSPSESNESNITDHVEGSECSDNQNIVHVQDVNCSNEQSGDPDQPDTCDVELPTKSSGLSNSCDFDVSSAFVKDEPEQQPEPEDKVRFCLECRIPFANHDDLLDHLVTHVKLPYIVVDKKSVPQSYVLNYRPPPLYFARKRIRPPNFSDLKFTAIKTGNSEYRLTSSTLDVNSIEEDYESVESFITGDDQDPFAGADDGSPKSNSVGEYRIVSPPVEENGDNEQRALPKLRIISCELLKKGPEYKDTNVWNDGPRITEITDLNNDDLQSDPLATDPLALPDLIQAPSANMVELNSLSNEGGSPAFPGSSPGQPDGARRPSSSDKDIDSQSNLLDTFFKDEMRSSNDVINIPSSETEYISLEKLHACGVCGESCSSQNALDEHRRITGHHYPGRDRSIVPYSSASSVLDNLPVPVQQLAQQVNRLQPGPVHQQNVLINIQQFGPAPQPQYHQPMHPPPYHPQYQQPVYRSPYPPPMPHPPHPIYYPPAASNMYSQQQQYPQNMMPPPPPQHRMPPPQQSQPRMQNPQQRAQQMQQRTSQPQNRPQMGQRMSGPRGPMPRGAPMIRPRMGPRMHQQPGVRPMQPRIVQHQGARGPQQQQQQFPAAKRRKMDVLLPDKHEDPDCQVISVQQPHAEGMPVIQDVQGADTSLQPDPVVHLTDSITLSVRNPPPASQQKKNEAKAVANILATRGITVTPAAKSQKEASATSPTVTKQNTPPPPPVAINLNSAVSIIPTQKQNKTSSAPAEKSASRPPTVDLTEDSPTTTTSSNRTSSALPHRCNLCAAQYPTAQGLAHHQRTYHRNNVAPTQPQAEFGLPLIDLKQPNVLARLSKLGIQQYIPLPHLKSAPGSFLSLPIVSVNGVKNPALANLAALGSGAVLSLGPVRNITTVNKPNNP